MTRLTRAIATAVLTAATIAVPSTGGAETPVIADNVDLLLNIPKPGAVGAKVRTINGTRYFIMTGQDGVTAYDVTDPESPVPAGYLPLPHMENEDVEFGDDVLLIAGDPAFTPGVTGLYVIDISRLPLITFAYVNPLTQNRWQGTLGTERYSGGHTVSCIREDCSYAYAMGPGGGSSKLYAINLADPSNPQLERVWTSPLGGTHDIQRDETGLVWMVGSGGFLAYDVTDPRNPVVKTRHNPAELTYHHNSFRPDASRYAPRPGGDLPLPDAGETLLITEERWLQPRCRGQGRFATASLVNFDQLDASGNPPSTVRVIDRWTPELGTLEDESNGQSYGTIVDGNQVATVTCSAHYFDYRNDIVAIGWYMQGTRFLDVSDPTNIRQVGYWLPTNAETWAAIWVTDDIVYTLDAVRGVDVLRFSGGTSSATVRAPVLPQWFDPHPSAVEPHPVWGYACSRRI